MTTRRTFAVTFVALIGALRYAFSIATSMSQKTQDAERVNRNLGRYSSQKRCNRNDSASSIPSCLNRCYDNRSVFVARGQEPTKTSSLGDGVVQLTRLYD